MSVDAQSSRNSSSFKQWRGSAHLTAGLAEHACLQVGNIRCISSQIETLFLTDHTYVLGKYEVIRLRNPPPDEELANGVTPRMMALRPVKHEATDHAS